MPVAVATDDDFAVRTVGRQNAVERGKGDFGLKRAIQFDVVGRESEVDEQIAGRLGLQWPRS